ncbi:TonB-dependent receptor [Neolewinella aurantiaca]|uniref:TonB-dependent receptor n=1 Tax=Neolewinella aurantiaca TaxID=2602767 RepID=A0A5C7FLL6_9BACT|nr:TonB-dependent receptor [Neolewinella aurantiaca]TXF90919.1 TonB-dependent receptor [Neolewinella aurantiaca]
MKTKIKFLPGLLLGLGLSLQLASQNDSGVNVETDTPPSGTEINVVRDSTLKDSLWSTFSSDLDQVVVTAQRRSASRQEAGNSVQLLSRDFLDRQTPRSMAEALVGVPGVWMQKTNHGGGSPFVRGLTGNQVLLLYDGIRLNNSTYRYGPNQYFNSIDPFSVERVEVVPGGGGVLYGSDALGGTINVLTREPQFAAGDSTLLTGRLLGRLRSSDMEKTMRAEVGVEKEKLALFAGVSLRDFGNLHGGGDLGELVATGYDERAVDVKAKFKTGKRSVLTAAYNGLVQTGVGRYDQVAQRGYARYDFDPQERQLAYLRWRLLPVASWWESFEVTAAHQQSREVRLKQKEDSEILTREDDRINTNSLAAVAGFRFNPAWTATVGAEAYHDQVFSSAFDQNVNGGEILPKRGLYPAEATALSYAVFTSHRYRVGNWAVSAGLRYNLFRTEFTDDTFGNTDFKPTALVWDGGLTYNLSQGQQLELKVASSFRAPNVNDLSSFGSFDFGIEVPSPDLEPERSLNTELAYRQYSGRLKWGVTVFRNQLRNLIEREQSTYLGEATYEGQDVYTKVNRSEATIFGAEADADFRLNDQWRIITNLSYTRGEADGKPMRRIPPLHGRFDVLYRPAKSKWFADGSLLWAGAQRRLSGGDVDDHRIAVGGTDGWLTVGVRGGYEWKAWTVTLFANNLNNAAYRLHGSGVDGAGRHAGMEVAWRW